MKTYLVIGALVLVAWLVLRKSSVTGGANLALAAGNNRPGPLPPAPPPPGTVGLPQLGLPGTVGGAAPWSGADVGSLIAGIGSGAGNLFTGIGNLVKDVPREQAGNGFYPTQTGGGQPYDTAGADTTGYETYGPTLDQAQPDYGPGY